MRAAAGIVPVIEAGLNDAKVTHERAALMAEFCLWSLEQRTFSDPEAAKLATIIEQGLERIHNRFDLARQGEAT